MNVQNLSDKDLIEIYQNINEFIKYLEKIKK